MVQRFLIWLGRNGRLSGDIDRTIGSTGMFLYTTSAVILPRHSDAANQLQNKLSRVYAVRLLVFAPTPCFDCPETLSHGKLTGDIRGTGAGAEYLARGGTASLFGADRNRHFARLYVITTADRGPWRDTRRRRRSPSGRSRAGRHDSTNSAKHSSTSTCRPMMPVVKASSLKSASWSRLRSSPFAWNSVPIRAVVSSSSASSQGRA